MDRGEEELEPAAGANPKDRSDGLLAVPAARSERYPDYLMPFVGQRELGPTEIAEAVEAFLLGFGYQTARAYRADLEDIYSWAARRGFLFMALTDDQLGLYQALTRRRRYSEGTVRRRRTAYRGFLRFLQEERMSGNAQ